MLNHFDSELKSVINVAQKGSNFHRRLDGLITVGQVLGNAMIMIVTSSSIFPVSVATYIAGFNSLIKGIDSHFGLAAKGERIDGVLKTVTDPRWDHFSDSLKAIKR